MKTVAEENYLRKTKIICTIGPASESEEMITALIKNGMNVARLNFSHGDFSEYGMRIERIRLISKELNTPVAILLDTKGPEIRIKSISLQDFCHCCSCFFTYLCKLFHCLPG